MVVMAHIRRDFTTVFYARMSEWFAACSLAAIGWILTQNDDLMAKTASQAYKLMLAIGPQHVWATIMIIFGCIRISILFINGTWRRSPHMRGITAFLSCFFWYQIALSFYAVFGISFILTAGMFILDLINMIRALGDAKIADYNHKEGIK